ncbi:MAG: hypothetical protein A3J75_08645 [Acidobacteria bacterium RBG_16_68_9]|nr:MAG: hypothetical protein A3J75_08645 [Acidobacteria bacterium RBG_16_68_9]
MLSATAAQAGPVPQRQKNQAARIHQGVEAGSLTRGEAKALRHEQRHINRFRRDALSDGHMDRKEMRILTNAQGKANRHIHRLKHNGQEVR